MAGAIVSRGLTYDVASVTVTGSDVALDLGFIPAFATGFNQTGLARWYWNQSMSNAQTLSSATLFGIIATSGGTTGPIAAGSGGITVLDGSAGTAIGLNIGTNTTINNSGDVWSVIAHRPG